MSVYLGDRLGWYALPRLRGAGDCSELAARTGTLPRYAREWLEQQAVVGLLTVEPTAQPTRASTRSRPAPRR